MSKQITYGEASRDAILRGIDSLANAVKVTLGPRGRNVMIGSSYGSNYGYGYGGYNGYGGNSCIAHDRYGRAYYLCGYGSYYGSNRYTYSPRTVVYYYPGYTYRSGYYFDSYNRRYDARTLYNRHHRRQTYRR